METVGNMFGLNGTWHSVMAAGDHSGPLRPKQIGERWIYLPQCGTPCVQCKSTATTKTKTKTRIAAASANPHKSNIIHSRGPRVRSTPSVESPNSNTRQ
eukprot:3045792-Amphidinium_carterae.1